MKYISLLAIMLITACGFTPTYGEKSVSDNLSLVEISTIPDRSGQILRNHLIDRFYEGGYPSSPIYRLNVSSVMESIVEIGIDKDDEASRAQLHQSVEFTLIDTQSDKTVLKRTSRATSGYNILSGQFTTYVTEVDARNQALKALAEDITTQIELYLAR